MSAGPQSPTLAVILARISTARAAAVRDLDTHENALVAAENDPSPEGTRALISATYLAGEAERRISLLDHLTSAAS